MPTTTTTSLVSGPPVRNPTHLCARQSREKGWTSCDRRLGARQWRHLRRDAPNAGRRPPTWSGGWALCVKIFRKSEAVKLPVTSTFDKLMSLICQQKQMSRHRFVVAINFENPHTTLVFSTRAPMIVLLWSKSSKATMAVHGKARYGRLHDNRVMICLWVFVLWVAMLSGPRLSGGVLNWPVKTLSDQLNQGD